MKVTVVPKRPIPGILPKNKWIDTKMELDLNALEIKRCMQFGEVYHEDEVIDEIKLRNLDLIMNSIHKKIKNDYIPPMMNSNKNIMKVIEELIKPQVVEEQPVISVQTVVEEIPPVVIPAAIVEEPPVAVSIPTVIAVEPPITNNEMEVVSITSIKEVSCIKDNDYIVLEFELDTKETLENVTATFKINCGSKPEYKVDEDKWMKFNYKFASFNELENNHKFVFRFIPSHKSPLKYDISLIQEKQDGESKISKKVHLDGTIDQLNL